MDYLRQVNQTITQFRIVAIISFLVALLCVAAYGITDSVSKQIVQNNISGMEQLALHDERIIQNSLDIRWNQLREVIRQLEKDNFKDAGEVASELRKSVPSVTFANYLMLVTNNGTEYSSSGIVSENTELRELIAGHNGRFVSGYFGGQADSKDRRKETIVMAVPVSISGPGLQFDWLMCNLSITTVESELKIDSYQGKGFAAVTDFDGNYIFNISRGHNLGGGNNFYDTLTGAKFDKYASLDELKKTLINGVHSVIYKDSAGEEFILVSAAMDFADWCYVTTVPMSVFNAQTQAVMTSFLVLLGIAIVVFLITLLLFIRQRRQAEKSKVKEAKRDAKTSFLFNMSHDIRTPMNIILGFTDIAANHLDDKERVNDCLTKIKYSSSLLLGLINDILEMSNAEQSAIEIESTPASILQIGDVVNPIIASLAEPKKIQYAYKCDNITSPFVHVDVEHLTRVLLNLLSNAIKYTRPGGQVNFELRQLRSGSNGKANFEFIISDTGIGMSKEFIENELFQEFSREKNSTQSKQQGSGLGLAIAKRIVDAMGGKIHITSVPDEGTEVTVCVSLELQSEEEIQTHAIDNRIEGNDITIDSFAGKKALLVEDNELNAEIAMDLMEDFGIIAEHVSDGLQSVERIKERGVDYYDFVLMDIQMPVMDGHEATLEIRKLPGGEDLVIVAVSANAFIEDKRKSMEVGMNDHIAKPVDIDELVKSLSKLIKE